MSLKYAMGNGPQAVVMDDSRKHITAQNLARKLGQRGRTNTKRIRLAEMGLTYRQYLQTEHWQTLRKAHIAAIGDQCQVENCSGRGVILHHRDYDQLGFERQTDVALVCSECHDKIHREMPALSKRRVREWIEKQDMARRRNFYAADRALVRECGRVRGELKKAGASPIEIQSRMIERGLIPDVRVKPKARKAGL